MWKRFVALAIACKTAHGFTTSFRGRAEPLLLSTRRLDQPRYNKQDMFAATSEGMALTAGVPFLEASGGKRLDPKEVAKSVRKEHTHILICPGFASSSKDYKKEGSLAPNLIRRGGWKEEQIHVLPVARNDWLGVWTEGLVDKDFVAALVSGAWGLGARPDRLPYRWYLKRVAQTIRKIDEAVKAEHGVDESAKVILVGHSAGGWLARAAVGYGNEHRMNTTKLERELGIDIDNILAIVTLGTPNLPPPQGSPDVTGGALKLTNTRFPGSYFEDKIFYVTVAGSGIEGKQDRLAYHSYKMVAGTGKMDGDGIVPTTTAHLKGANRVNLQNIHHASQLAENRVGDALYGSDVVIGEWFGEVLHHLECLQNADMVLPREPEQPVELQEVDERVAPNETVSHYFRRRNALRHSGIYSKVEDPKTLERLVFCMEEFSVPLNTTVFAQGDKADAMYFVTSGNFECFDENTGNVIAVVGKNQVFGELGVLLNESRALSVRAATPNAKIYKLAREDIDKYVLGEETSQAAANLKEAGRYAEYFDEKAKRDTLKACPVFKDIGNGDLKRLVAAMQRMEVPAGERIIEEGTRGDSMYFVINGGFACYRESNQNVVKVCEDGDYFGELGVLFNRQRAVSIRATKPSAVWELHGDAFLDIYRKRTASKFGAASWISPVGKLFRADKWIGRVVPKPICKTLQNVPFVAGHLINRIKFLHSHLEANRWKGTRAHINNALISLVTLFYFWARRASAGTVLSKTIMSIGLLGLVVDNLVNASGKYIGEGDLLRRLCKIRSISHGMTIPLLFIPIIEAGMLSGLFPTRAAKFAMAAAAVVSAHEFLDWLSFDTNNMTAVDNRDSTRHSAQAVAGTFFYTSGKVLKNVLPVVTLNLFTLVVGTALMKSGVPAGSWLLASGLLTFLSCSLQRPDIQMYGEPTMMGLIWAAAASCVP